MINEQMNKRIKELLSQAGIMQPERFNTVDGGNQLEKFAELIVQECLNLVEPDTDMKCNQEWYFTLEETAQCIRKHFGVE